MQKIKMNVDKAIADVFLDMVNEDMVTFDLDRPYCAIVTNIGAVAIPVLEVYSDGFKTLDDGDEVFYGFVPFKRISKSLAENIKKKKEEEEKQTKKNTKIN